MLGLDESLSAGMKPLRMQVKISAPGASADELPNLVHWVCSHSPVGCTDPSAATIDVQVE